MCIIVAKYFPGIGWAGAKNRDRKYIPKLDFIESEENGVDRMMMHDKITGYKEGINSHGISILNTSLDVDSDEPDVEEGKAASSPDGKIIAAALLQNNVKDAVRLLIKHKLVGCTIVFDQHTLYLIEGSDQDGTKPYRYKVKQIPKSETVTRTNHGIWMPWAGFQRGSGDKQQEMDRISSEARLAQAQRVVEYAEDPEDLVDGLCQVYTTNPQLNIMRTNTGDNKYRTTSQQLCVPREKTLYCRPVSSHLEFDFWRLNRPETRVWVEILSNRALWQNTRGEPPFGHLNLKDVEHESP
jgi:hypothetical protein